MGLDSNHSEESNSLLGKHVAEELAIDETLLIASPPYTPPVQPMLQATPSTSVNMEDDAGIEEPRICRICQSGESDSEDDDSIYHDEEAIVSGQRQHCQTGDATKHSKAIPVYQKNPLIKPCKCKGSMMYVHLDCLNRWRKESPRATSTYACDLCGYKYHLYRPMYAYLIANPWFINITTAIIIILIVLIATLLSFFIDVHLLGNPQRQKEIYIASGVIVTAVFGLIIFTVRSATEGSSSAAMPNWCCPDGIYPCYLVDCGAIGGGDAALAGLFVIIIVLALTVLMFGMVGAVSGVYVLVEKYVEKIAGKVKERILDVD